MPKARARRVPALAPARLRAFIDRLKLAKLAGREPKRAASLCPTVLLKIAGDGAANESAAVIPVLAGDETPRIKVDSALRNRGSRGDAPSARPGRCALWPLLARSWMG